ncbi:MAG TPA: hypothetical protein VN603_07165 [Candidatus Acidoferrales bacterium]|nr:hypothetical protein [Candidatus Acidoferrales bacterium]
MLDELPMTALVDARALLGKQPARLRMLLPPFPALGCGALRALRVCERNNILEIVAGYESYEKLT